MKVWGRYATITHPRGSGGAVLGANFGAPRSGMWLSKVARRDENLVQYLKNSLDIVLDAKTFDASGKSDF